MNAIQFFDWGGDGDKSIPFCSVRLKNFFKIPKSDKFPWNALSENMTSVVYSTDGLDARVIKSKTAITKKEGNDFVLNFFIKESSLRDRKNLTVINFNCYLDGSLFNVGKSTKFYAEIYVSGRKIKRDRGFSQVSFWEKNIGANMGENGSVRFEDNNEAVTLSSLLNKEIVFELEN